MQHLPIFIPLRKADILIVGGGPAAAGKLRLLLGSPAAITLLARSPGTEVAALARAGGIEIRRRAFADADAEGRTLVFAASGCAEVDAGVAAAARAAGVPVNAVDRPELCTFIMPAIVDRDPIVIGVSSGGTSPALARRIRTQVECMLPAGLGPLARFAGSFRGAVRAGIADAAVRRRFWERFFDGPLARAVMDGNAAAAAAGMMALLNRGNPVPAAQGRISIVATAPDSPDLLTLRALNLLQQADVVIHDRQIGPELLDYARRGAARIEVGRSPSGHATPEAEIAALMVRHAKAGRRVVRLGAGDLFLRGGSEVEHLRRQQVAVEVVPDVGGPDSAEIAPALGGHARIAAR